MEAAGGAILSDQTSLSYHHSSYTIYGGAILELMPKDQVMGWRTIIDKYMLEENHYMKPNPIGQPFMRKMTKLRI